MPTAPEALSPRRAARSGQPDASRFPFADYPVGWFAVALSSDVTRGEIKRMRYFGRELVAYRGESGQVFVTDAYCPHMGAHLAHGGAVEGDCVRCPFHGWKFSGDGQCVEVPYSERVPPKAKLGAWPVLEQNGVIHVFYRRDPAQEPWPLPELDDRDFVLGGTVLWEGLKTHPQEIFENTVDCAHIGPIHDGQAARVNTTRRDGHYLVVTLEFDAPGDVVDMPGTLNHVDMTVEMHGIGCIVVNTHVTTAGVRARQRIFATPIDEDTLDLRGVVAVERQDDPVFTQELADIFYRAYVKDFARDFPIWENKRYLERPVLAKGDGPIGLYRRWAAQFYPDADATSAAEVVARRDAPAFTPLFARLGGLTRRVRQTASWLSNELLERSRAAGDGQGDEQEHEDEQERSEGAGGVGHQPPPAKAPSAAAAAKGASVTSVDEYFNTLEQRFVPAAAKGVDAVFQWELAGAQGRTFHARVQAGSISVHEGAHNDPTVVLAMDGEDYVRVVNGELNGMRVFASGRGKIRGSVSAAMKMRTLFPAA
ncbi:MAG: Rieske 2Fe-2S domain-containing protein [Myxococcales bacterium]|nr:Rieske 2Fe-2S domain-containing protein [Myxococcales bacterium]